MFSKGFSWEEDSLQTLTRFLFLAALFWTGSKGIMIVNVNECEIELWNFTAPIPFVSFYDGYKLWSTFAIIL